MRARSYLDPDRAVRSLTGTTGGRTGPLVSRGAARGAIRRACKCRKSTLFLGSSGVLVHDRPAAGAVPGLGLDATLVAKVDGRPPVLELDLPAQLGARRLGLVFGHPQAAVRLSNVWLHDLTHCPAPVTITRVKGDVRAPEDAVC